LPPYLENLYGNGRASEEIVSAMEKKRGSTTSHG